ncbi:MAG: hypothetical protein AAFQ02_06485, partial [Bacteroidota bacterium]
MWRWYVLSNLHIAMCAVVFTLAGFVHFEVDLDVRVPIVFGVGTFMVYVIHRKISANRYKGIHSPLRFDVFRGEGQDFMPLLVASMIIESI